MSRVFTLDDRDPVFLDESSEGAGHALVCLHGLGGGGYFFSGLAAATEDRHVICPDLPGSGFSPRGSRPVTFDRLADAAAQLIERNTHGPVALLGHSMGTILALMVLARIPSRIGSLIFVGGLPAPLPEVQARLRDRAAMAGASGMRAVAPTIPPVVFSRRSLLSLPDKVAMFQRLLALSDAQGYAETASALADASAIDVVKQVRVPCLCMTGAEDRYAPPTYVRAFAASIAGAIYRELPDCGHMPFFEDPDSFNQCVKEFLRDSALAR